jgi:hypothetical protein
MLYINKIYSVFVFKSSNSSVCSASRILRALLPMVSMAHASQDSSAVTWEEYLWGAVPETGAPVVSVSVLLYHEWVGRRFLCSVGCFPLHYMTQNAINLFLSSLMKFSLHQFSDIFVSEMCYMFQPCFSIYIYIYIYICIHTHIPYFSIDNAHLMYNTHPKLFRHSFWYLYSFTVHVAITHIKNQLMHN